MKMTREQELQLIEDALNTDKYKRIPLGESSADDGFIDFKQSHSLILRGVALQKRGRQKKCLY